MSGIRLRTKLIVTVLAGLAVFMGCQRNADTTSQTVPYYNTPDFTPIWLNTPPEVNRQITHTIADFQLRDQTNRLVSQGTIAGKVHVANFFFTACPSVCPKMTNLLRAVQDTFRHNPNVVLLSYSVTPWLDSVPRLRAYAAHNRIDATQWHLLTGDRSLLYTLARRSYFAEETIGFTRDSTEFLHTEHLILVDRNRRIRGVYNGTKRLDIDKLITDMRALLADSND